jgi:hypothetical protein
LAAPQNEPGSSPAPAQSPPEDESTGLPLIRRWPTVYILVSALFILWVALLITFTRVFS